MTLQVGDLAPDFLLFDQTGQEPRHALSQYGGWKLIWWIPSTMVEHASGCSDRIANGFTTHGDERLAVFGLSFDDAKLAKEFYRRAAMDFPLLTADVETAKAYGVYRGDEDEWNCFPRKRAFLVDPDGRIAKVYLNIDPDYFVHDVLDDLAELAPRKTGILGRVLASLKG